MKRRKWTIVLAATCLIGGISALLWNLAPDHDPTSESQLAQKFVSEWAAIAYAQAGGGDLFIRADHGKVHDLILGVGEYGEGCPPNPRFIPVTGFPFLRYSGTDKSLNVAPKSEWEKALPELVDGVCGISPPPNSKIVVKDMQYFNIATGSRLKLAARMGNGMFYSRSGKYVAVFSTTGHSTKSWLGGAGYPTGKRFLEIFSCQDGNRIGGPFNLALEDESVAACTFSPSDRYVICYTQSFKEMWIIPVGGSEAKP